MCAFAKGDHLNESHPLTSLPDRRLSLRTGDKKDRPNLRLLRQRDVCKEAGRRVHCLFSTQGRERTVPSVCGAKRRTLWSKLEMPSESCKTFDIMWKCLATTSRTSKYTLSAAPETDTADTMEGLTCRIRFLSENAGARSALNSLVVAWRPQLTSSELRQQFLGANNSMMMVQCGEIFSSTIARHRGAVQSYCTNGVGGYCSRVDPSCRRRTSSLPRSLRPSLLLCITGSIPSQKSEQRSQEAYLYVEIATVFFRLLIWHHALLV